MNNYYSNGAYLVKGRRILNTIKGEIVGTFYPQTYALGARVSFSVYHRGRDGKWERAFKKIDVSGLWKEWVRGSRGPAPPAKTQP